MSLTTWKQEFYPTEARDCPAEDAIAHSLQKWVGLRLDTLAKHDLKVQSYGWVEGVDGTFIASASTCALCVRFYDDDADRPCGRCPLSVSRGGFACDKLAQGETDSPWITWTNNKDPEPMIAALEKAAALTSPQEEQRAL